MVHHEQVVAGVRIRRLVERQGGPAVDFSAITVFLPQGRKVFSIGSIWIHGSWRLAVVGSRSFASSGGAKKKPPRFGTGGVNSFGNDQNPRGAKCDDTTTTAEAPMEAMAKAWLWRLMI